MSKTSINIALTDLGLIRAPSDSGSEQVIRWTVCHYTQDVRRGAGRGAEALTADLARDLRLDSSITAQDRQTIEQHYSQDPGSRIDTLLKSQLCSYFGLPLQAQVVATANIKTTIDKTQVMGADTVRLSAQTEDARGISFQLPRVLAPYIKDMYSEPDLLSYRLPSIGLQAVYLLNEREGFHIDEKGDVSTQASRETAFHLDSVSINGDDDKGIAQILLTNNSDVDSAELKAVRRWALEQTGDLAKVFENEEQHRQLASKIAETLPVNTLNDTVSQLQSEFKSGHLAKAKQLLDDLSVQLSAMKDALAETQPNLTEQQFNSLLSQCCTIRHENTAQMQFVITLLRLDLQRNSNVSHQRLQALAVFDMLGLVRNVSSLEKQWYQYQLEQHKQQDVANIVNVPVFQNVFAASFPESLRDEPNFANTIARFTRFPDATKRDQAIFDYLIERMPLDEVWPALNQIFQFYPTTQLQDLHNRFDQYVIQTYPSKVTAFDQAVIETLVQKYSAAYPTLSADATSMPAPEMIEQTQLIKTSLPTVLKLADRLYPRFVSTKQQQQPEQSDELLAKTIVCDEYKPEKCVKYIFNRILDGNCKVGWFGGLIGGEEITLQDKGSNSIKTIRVSDCQKQILDLVKKQRDLRAEHAANKLNVPNEILPEGLLLWSDVLKEILKKIDAAEAKRLSSFGRSEDTKLMYKDFRSQIETINPISNVSLNDNAHVVLPSPKSILSLLFRSKPDDAKITETTFRATEALGL